METEQLVSSYIDNLILVENKGCQFQQKFILPDNSVILGFLLTGTISEDCGGQAVNLPVSLLCGPLTKSKQYTISPNSSAIFVKLKPWVAQFFVETKMYELRDCNNSIAHLMDYHFIEQLTYIIYLSDNVKRDIIYFLSKRYDYSPVDKSILQAVSNIYKVNGRIKVAELAYQVCNSKRNFERKFKSSTGLTPKRFIANVRFQNSLKLLHENQELSDIAYQCGYYDSSHFSNEVKEITGLTPQNIASKLCRIFPMKRVFINSPLQYTSI